MNAGELCTRRVITAEGHELVVDAARRMTDENVGDLVVIERVANGMHPIGIVTDRDLVTGVLTRGTPAALELRVKDVMHADLVTACDDEQIEHVLAKMERHDIRRLPIVDRGGLLQGILALDDIITWIRAQLDQASALLEQQSEGLAIHP